MAAPKRPATRPAAHRLVGLVLGLTGALTLGTFALGAVFPGDARAASAPVADRTISVDTRLGQSSFVPGHTGAIYLRINLQGLAVPGDHARPPVNVAVVIDKSGSMSGQKIARAREAALMAVQRLTTADVASVIAYNQKVDVLVPATRVTETDGFTAAIRTLQAGGNTALYAGTRQGISEVRKFRSDDAVNRVILLSDGLANVGPSSPDDLARLGLAAVKDGIAISTIGLGLGYNEDLMAKLAYNSDGNHAFVESADDLVTVFNQEFGDVLSVVAQDIVIEIQCRNGFRPKRVLGRTAEIDGDRIRLRLNQIHAQNAKYALIELEVPGSARPGETTVADVTVDYRAIESGTRARLTQTVRGTLTTSTADADQSLDKAVMRDVTVQIANEASEQAVRLRDAGDLAGAKRILKRSAASVSVAAGLYGGAALEDLSAQTEEEAEAVAKPREWNKTRKSMRARQHKAKTQQNY